MKAGGGKGDSVGDARLGPMEVHGPALPRQPDLPSRRLHANQTCPVGGVKGTSPVGAPGDVQVLDGDGRTLGLGVVDADGCLRAKRLFRWAARG